MSFGGHVSTMINRLQENRSLLNRKSIKDRRKDAFGNHYKTQKTSKQTNHKKADPKVLRRLKAVLKRDKSKQRTKLRYMGLTLLFLSVVIIYSIFTFMGLF